MKKEISKEMLLCDICGDSIEETTALDKKCGVCGRDVCSPCREDFYFWYIPIICKECLKRDAVQDAIKDSKKMESAFSRQIKKRFQKLNIKKMLEEG